MNTAPAESVDQADLVVNGRFGGVGPAADATGLPRHLFRDWLKSGIVPEKHRLLLLRKARAAGLPHVVEDYTHHLRIALDQNTGDEPASAGDRCNHGQE